MFIALAKCISEQEIFQAFREFFPALIVEDWHFAVARDPLMLPDIALSINPNPSNFPVYIDIMLFMGSVCAPYEISIELARLFSLRWECSTACDPGPFQPEDQPRNPYTVIIWQDGQAYLGDDYDFDLENGGTIKILYPIDVPPGDLLRSVSEWEKTLM
jgi:hypothetical protein